MADAPNPLRQTLGSIGGHTSWSRTADRTARTRPARSQSPGSVAYWLKRLPAEFDGATDAQRLAAAESAKKAYFARLALKSAEARRKGGNDAA